MGNYYLKYIHEENRGETKINLQMSGTSTIIEATSWCIIFCSLAHK